MTDLLQRYFTDRIAICTVSLKKIADCFSLKRTRRKEVLLRQGEVCRHYYFVNKGCLRVYAVNEQGQEATRYFAFEGAFGGALPSLIDGTPSFDFVETIEPSELLCISRADFFHLVDTVPQMAFIYRRILEQSFITAQKRIYGFQHSDAMEKLRWVMEYQPALLTRVSNKMAASFLGLTPSTLSRLKTKL